MHKLHQQIKNGAINSEVRPLDIINMNKAEERYASWFCRSNITQEQQHLFSF